MQRRSLSILSIGWFSTAVLPPFLHPTVQNAQGRVRGEFVLYPRDGTWSIFVQEFHTVSPVLAFRLSDDVIGAQVANDPIINPYSAGDLKEFVTFLEQEASKRDLIVLGYCNGEGMRRVRRLSESTRRKTVLVHWDPPIPADHTQELADLGTLGGAPREGFLDWLVARITSVDESDEAIEALPDEELDHLHQTELDLADEGVGLGV